MIIEDSKILFRYTKFLIPLLTIWSLIRLVIFYSRFQINIGDYITLDEILTPFINDLFFYTLTIFIPIIILDIFIGQKIAQENLNRFKLYKGKPFIKRLWVDIKTYWIFWGIQIITVIVFIIKDRPIDLLLGTITSVPLMYFIFWIRKEYLIKTNFEFTPNNTALYNISTLLIVFFLVSISETFLKVDKIKNDNRYQKTVSIYFDSSKLICKDSLAFIGRTKNYTFVFNRKLKLTTAISNSEIKRIDTND